jgi:hypothetical protein
VRFCDEHAFGFGWITDEEQVPRTSHALAADGGVWAVDPVSWPAAEERLRGLGEPRGVVQLLDRHERDCAAFAERLGVGLHVVPFEPLAGAPFEFLPVLKTRFWRESALWWPERRVLVCADAVGTLPYFLAVGEPVGVHPLLRLKPPRALATVHPLYVLCGHGEGGHGEGVARALHEAVRTARRRLPSAWWNGIRHGRGQKR